MRLHADRLHLSPSDVTAFLACEHLTTLSLAHARGEIERPEVENEQAELIFRKGLEHEHAYLERLARRREDRPRDRSTRAATTRRRAARPPTRSAPARPTSSTRASSRTTAGAASPTSSCASRTAPTRRSTPSSRAHAKPAYILQLLFYNEQLARIQGREPEQIHVLLGIGEQAVLPARASSPPTTGASARGSSASSPTRRRPSRTRSTTAAICDFKPLCDAYWDAVDHLSRVAGVYRTQIEKLAAAGITTLAQLGRAPAEPVPAGINRRHAGRRTASRPSSSSRARDRRGHVTGSSSRSRRPASRSCPTPRPATSSSTSRATRSGTRTARSSTSGGSSTSTATSRRCTRTTTTTERHAFETFVDLVHERLARHPDLHVYHYAAYEITALKRLMGRYGTREARARRPAPPRRLRRPAQGRPQRHPRLAARLRAEGAGGLPRLRAAGGGEGRRHLDRRLRAVDADARRRRCSTRSTSTTARTASRRGSCATGCSSGAPRRSRSSGRSRCPSRRSRSRSRRRRSSAPRCARELLDAGEELAAQLLDYHDRERKPVWWAFFDRLEMTPAELVEDAESIGRLELDRRARAGRSARSRTRSPSRRRSTSSALGQRRDRSGDARRRRRDHRARPRGAPARAQARAVARGRAAAGGADPGRRRTARTIRRTRSSASAARCSPATAATPRSSRSSGASRSTGPSRRPTSTR